MKTRVEKILRNSHGIQRGYVFSVTYDRKSFDVIMTDDLTVCILKKILTRYNLIIIVPSQSGSKCSDAGTPY